MARTWLSISVELVSGRGEDFWPRPGRVFAAARSHTSAALAEAIDQGFARWARAHLHQFWLGEGDGRRVGQPDPDDDFDDDVLDGSHQTLARLVAGERFADEFDFGDRWLHPCTVDAQRIDPLETLGVIRDKPLPYWGWGNLPRSVRPCLERGRRRLPASTEPEGCGPPSTRALAVASPTPREARQRPPLTMPNQESSRAEPPTPSIRERA